MDQQTFDVTPQQFDRMKGMVHDQLGITIAADKGEATGNHITVGWEYDRATNKLSLSCIHKPLFVPASMVQNRIRDLVQSVTAV